MFAKLPIRVPSPALIIATVALLFAMGGYASAGEKDNKDEVAVAVAQGGPVDTGDPGERIPIPLSNSTFVQKAGEAVVLIARAEVSVSPNTNFCGAEIVVRLAGEGGSDLRLFMIDHSNKGEDGEHTDVEALVAPAVDTLRTLEAFAVEDDQDDDGNPSGCDDPNPPEGPAGEDTFTVSLQVTIVALRD